MMTEPVGHGAQRWLLRAAAFLLPLLVAWNTVDRFVLPKLLAARVLVMAMLVLLLARSLATGSWSWRRTALDFPLLGFVAASALATLFAVNRHLALFGSYLRYEGLLTILTYAAIFWLAAQLIVDEREPRALGRSLLLGAYVVSLLAIAQSITGWGPGVETSVGACVRAFATFGSPVELGTFLAMVIPLALYELFDATQRADRVIAANVLLVLTVALLLTFTRAAWGAALVGAILVAIARRPARRVLLITAGALIALLLIGFGLGQIGGPNSLAQCVGSRAETLAAPDEGSLGFRLHVWSDSLPLIRQRPIFGFGPDTFALVYPSVQRSDWAPGYVIDKAHNELLQIAITSGLIGAAAYLSILGVIVVTWWRRRRTGWTAAMLAGLLAYQVALQAEFSWVPSALLFWFAASTAFVTSGPAAALARRRFTARSLRLAAITLLVLAGTALAVFAVVPIYRADVLFLSGLREAGTGQRMAAQSAIKSARNLNPAESVYAVEAGNLDLDLTDRGIPGQGADLRAARAAYEDAVRLGTSNAAAYRGLALAQYHLGNRAQAVAAARQAVALDRFDPANQALLNFLESRSA